MNSPMYNLVNFLIQRNPQVQNNPMAQQWLQTIQNGDSKTGEQIARNLCQSRGITPEQATAEAKKFFGI